MFVERVGVCGVFRGVCGFKGLTVHVSLTVTETEDEGDPLQGVTVHAQRPTHDKIRWRITERILFEIPIRLHNMFRSHQGLLCHLIIADGALYHARPM